MRGSRIPALILTVVLALAANGLAHAQTPGAPPPGFSFDAGRWPYPLHQEVGEQLRRLAAKYPRLARLHTIGQSAEGRDLWVLEITNQATGAGETKPALWLDGNIHAGEVTGRPLLMYFSERALASHGSDQTMTRLIDTRTFYVMPILDADGGERTLTRHPAWPGHQPGQHQGRDLDGDGYLTQMRVKDPDGEWYPSSIDPRLMLRLRRSGGITMGWDFIPRNLDEKPSADDELAPRGARYRVYTEGQDLERAVTDDPEPANFNRNWAAEWNPAEPGAGPFPFSLPEVYAVAKFITSHRNIYFVYTIHSGGGAKNYIVRPPMSHPFEFMPPEDNDFYTRVGAVWSALTSGGVMNNNYYAQEVKAGRYGDTMTGFSNDWAYMHVGVHSLLPEIAAAGRDYDADGYVTQYEVLRWNDDVKGGKYFAPWKPYRHPSLGEVEIGGFRGLPQGSDERLAFECDVHYRLIAHVAGLSPLLRLKNVATERQENGTWLVRAVVQNEGFLSTYVTRNALKIGRDEPIMASVEVKGGELVEGRAVVTVGHILGKLAYLRRWGSGADESTREVQWRVRPTGAEAPVVAVTVRAHKAGRDSRTVRLAADSSQ